MDVALIPSAVLAFIGWWRGYDPASPAIPWWCFIWLGPALYAARRLWKSGLPGRRLQAAIPLVGFVLLGWLEVAIGFTRAWSWWLSHVAMAFLLFVLALGLRSRGVTRRFAPRLALLTLAVLAFPWIGLGTLNDFWRRCVRLRPGMSVEQVVGAFGGFYVQHPGTQDGNDCSPVDGLRLEDWRTSDGIEFCPFAGEEATADGCWTRFEEGRLVDFWPSPD